MNQLEYSQSNLDVFAKLMLDINKYLYFYFFPERGKIPVSLIGSKNFFSGEAISSYEQKKSVFALFISEQIGAFNLFFNMIFPEDSQLVSNKKHILRSDIFNILKKKEFYNHLIHSIRVGSEEKYKFSDEVIKKDFQDYLQSFFFDKSLNNRWSLRDETLFFSLLPFFVSPILNDFCPNLPDPKVSALKQAFSSDSEEPLLCTTCQP